MNKKTSLEHTTPYALLGGERGLRWIVERFYDVMDGVPEFYGIRKLHPQDLSGSREKLFLFLSGWLGGPPLYQQKYGQRPCVQRRRCAQARYTHSRSPKAA